MIVLNCRADLPVPSPAGNWAVDNGRPAKSKDHGWQDASTLKGSTNDELYSAGTEKQLVQACTVSTSG